MKHWNGRAAAGLLSFIFCAGLLAACGQPAPAVTEAPAPTATETPATSAPEPTPGLPEVALTEHRRTVTDEDSGRTLLEGRYVTAALSEKSAADWPALAKVLDAASAKLREDTEAELDLMAEAARSDELLPVTDGYYSLDVALSVARADETALSLLRSGYVFTNGAHGSTFYAAWNFDTATGETLALADVVTDMDALREALETELLKTYPAEIFFDLHASIAARRAEDFVWVLEPDGLHFYFPHYDLAPYAAGVQDALLSGADYPELFRDIYR